MLRDLNLHENGLVSIIFPSLVYNFIDWIVYSRYFFAHTNVSHVLTLSRICVVKSMTHVVWY